MDDIKLERAAVELNPWWKGGAPDAKMLPRELSAEIQRYLPQRQMIAITGLRRTGKTTLLYRTIGGLLQANRPESILYFSFDDFSDADPYALPSAARAITGAEPRYLFFDEIQKVPGWQEKVKRLYDTGRHKIFLSGSESLFIKGKARESLAGRIYEFQLKPLSFSEYAAFSGAGANPRLNAAELRALFAGYLSTGGFPELVGVHDAAVVRKYVRESILEKVLFSDVPRLFSIEEPSIMQSALNVILDSPGLLVEASSLSRDFGVSRQTLSKYLYALEASLLVKKLYNFSKSRTSTERKLKKYYPAFACSALAPAPDELHMSRLVETACVLHSGAQFFWRTPQKDEVDMVVGEGRNIMPVEVKWGRKAGSSGMEKFMARFGCARGLVLTRDARGKEGRVKRMPVVDFLLSRRAV